MNLCSTEETQKLHLKMDLFTHCLMQDMNAFKLQLQMHKYFFHIWILKRWILIFEIILTKNEKVL